jgi:hypothetical protein
MSDTDLSGLLFHDFHFEDSSLLRISSLLMLCLVVPALSFAGVSTSAPANGATVNSPTHFVASATSPNGPIASMTINVDSKDVYKTFTNSLNTSVALAARVSFRHHEGVGQ